MILKNQLGTFDFPEGTQLCHAKLVRDTVTGQWFNPKQYEDRLYDEEDCQEFIRQSDSRVISSVEFTLDILVPLPEKPKKKVRHGAIKGSDHYEAHVEATEPLVPA